MTSVSNLEPALTGSTPLHVGVVAPRRRLAWVRVLHESLGRHHPAASLTVLVLDGSSEGEPFAQVGPGDVIGDDAHWHRLAMLLRPDELARALAPSLARYLLNAGGTVLLLGDDVLVRGSLDDLARLAPQRGVALIRRRSSPLPDDGRRPDAADLARLGTVDEAIVAVAGEGDMLAWWERAISESWLSGQEERPLLDVAAAEFPHCIVDNPEHGCARWNLDEPGRDATRARTLRLPGFDPEEPHLLAARPGEAPRVLLSEHPEIALICSEHADSLRRHGHAVTASLGYGLDRLACGLRRDDVSREVYREAVVFGTARGDPEPADPYDPADSEAFRAWLAEPVVRSADGFEVSRYLYEVYRCRGDLQSLFPDLRTAAGPLVEWAYRYGRGELHIPSEVLPPRTAALPGPRGELARDGVNVAGYFRSEFGIGEAARLLIDGLDAAEIPHVTTTYTRAPTRHGHAFDERGGGHPYATNIVCVNVDRIEQFAYDAGPEFFDGRRTVGYWWWEAGVLPEHLRAAFGVVDEVWVGSDYVRSLIAPVTDKPVLTMPVPIRLPPPTTLPREQLGLPEGFLFLFVFDFFSSIERKNPLGLIEAYRQAFDPGDGAALVLKSVNGEHRLDELELLRAAASGRDDIVTIDRYVAAEERGGMMTACDCYVSLHRSEGLGLTMAEAMALGKPVIATGWSGNLEFMSEENSRLVRYEMTTLERAHGPYPAGAEWAEPDLGHAAQVMRTIFDDREAAAALGERARASIMEEHGTGPTAEFLRQRLATINAETVATPAAAREMKTPPAAARAQAWLATGLTESWNHESSLGSAGTHARRAMLRAIQPYTRRQAELDRLLVEAATESHGGIAELLARVVSLEEQVLTLQAAAAGTARTLREHEERATTRGRSLDAVRDDLTRLSLGESTYRNDAAVITSLQRVYADLLNRSGPMGDGAFVEAVYRRVLRRAVDAEGAATSEAVLRSGLQSRSSLVASLVASPEYAALRELEDAISRSRHGPLRELRASARTDERQIEIPWALSRHDRAERILDVGYANARDPYLDALVELGVEELVGVDLAARDVPGMRSVVADLRALPFADGEFDLVFCISTLEHVGWDNTVYGVAAEHDTSGMLTALGEFRRVTAADGRILVTVPCGLEEHHGWLVQKPASEWLRLFESAKLQIAEYEIYELEDDGWRSVDGDPAVRYGERGPAASAVLCAIVTRKVCAKESH